MDRNLSLVNEKELTALGKALSSETRIRILHLLGREPLCVNEIAELLEIPSSSAALNIRVLEEAGLIRTELRPAARGSMKMCIPQEGKVILDFQRQTEKKKEEIISMPVGNYVDYKITPTCGMVNEEGYIDGEDEPRCFYDPKRTTAKLIWFSSGYLEYRFPNAALQEQPARVLEFSAELCSEAPDYNLDYPSDITLWISHTDGVLHRFQHTGEALVSGRHAFLSLTNFRNISKGPKPSQMCAFHSNHRGNVDKGIKR